MSSSNPIETCVELDDSAIDSIADVLVRQRGPRAAHFVVERIAEGKTACVATWLRVYERLMVDERIAL